MLTGNSITVEQFQQILDVSRMLAVTTELDALLLRIAEAATSLLDCERASIFLHDPKSDELWTKVALRSGQIRVPSSAGIVGHVFKNNTVLHVPRPYDDPRFNPEPDRRSGFVTRNLLGAPMLDLSRQPIGVIQAINHRDSIGFGSSHTALIQLLADQAGVAIQRYRLQESALEAISLRREMELASEVQQALIPNAPPKMRGLDAVGWTKPASTTGGDCFDLWQTHDGRLGIFVGDASGHGLGPALVVSQTRTLVRAMCDSTPDPHALLACANARLNEDLKLGQFVTAFVGFLSADGELTWSAAGHGPILVRRGRGEVIHKLQPPAPPLGVVPDYLGRRTKKLKIAAGGMVSVVSDGVTDALDPSGIMFDMPRYVARLEELQDLPADGLLRTIQSDLLRWQQADVPTDDQTVVIVKKV